MPKALQSVILRDATGEEYRLVVGVEAPRMPEHLAEAAERNGYIEKGSGPDERPAARVNHNSRKGDK